MPAGRCGGPSPGLVVGFYIARAELCESLGIPFNTVERSFPDRDAAKEWIIRNQFARRNLTTFARAELALRLEPLIAAKAKKNQQQSRGRGQKGCQKSDNLIDTKVELAAIAGVSHDTIHKTKLVIEYADEATKALLRSSKDKSLNAVAKAVKENNQRQQRTAKRMEAASGTYRRTYRFGCKQCLTRKQ